MRIMQRRRLAWLAVLTSGLLLIAGHAPHPEAAAAVTVRTEHPRIWLTPAILTRLRAEAAANSPRWLELKRVCDAYKDPSWDVGILDYALAYQVSGDPTYADKAITLMDVSVGNGLKAITPDSGYQARNLLVGEAVGYDWCYDRLTPDQRIRFRTQMEQWAEWVWPETNPSRARDWAIDNPGNNYYHGFMLTWLVGLALAGESPKAPGYIDLALKKWKTRVLPYLATTGAGGYLLEGTNYGTSSTRYMFWYLAAHASATGEDLLNAPGFSWAHDAVICKLHLTVPALDRLYPGGDQARDSGAPISDYDRGPMLVAQSYLDPTTAGYARWWLDHVKPSRNEWRFTQWEEFLWYRDDVPALDYTQALPAGYRSPGAGWLSSRSGWDTNATQVTMMVGPTLESHQDRAQNGFLIFRGEWLAASAKLTSHSGLIQDASANNSLTIGGHEQFYGQDTAKLLHFEDRPQYAYFSGEAAPAYRKDGVNYLNEFRRELLFLKPGRVVIFDHVDATDGKLEKRWHLNTLDEPTVDGHSYRATAGDSVLFGRTMVPMEARVTKQPLSYGRNDQLSSWRIDVAAPTGQNEDDFLNVLEVAPSTQTAMTTMLPVTAARGSLIGAQIGSQLVLFDAAPSWSITYQLNSLPASEHYILDQAPNKWYRVMVQSGRGILLQSQRVQATEHGVLAFTITAVTGRTVSIYPETASVKRKTRTPVKTATGTRRRTGGTRITRKG